jgi:predicted nucleic acid-binding protein
MGKIESEISVVCDAGPAIHLDELGCIDLLKYFQEILLPSTVWGEINRHRPSVFKNEDVPFSQVAGKTPSSEPLLTLCKIFSLDAGEIEALVILEQRPHAMFLTDDAAARLVAKQMNFNVHGTIGILIRSIRGWQDARFDAEKTRSIFAEAPTSDLRSLTSDL